MLSATTRIVFTSKRFVYPCVMQRSLAQAVSDRPQFDPIIARKSFKKTHDHSMMFKIEKYFSAAMLPLLPAAYFVHGPAMDTALAIAITLHVHWGLHGVLSDYGRAYVLGPTAAKIVQGPVSYILSICLLAGLLHFNSNDVGITKAFEMASNCSVCFGAIYTNMFISGCRRNNLLESKTLYEFYGVMCSRAPGYCGHNLCCCTSISCYSELRNHFLRDIHQVGRAVTCDVYRQQWIGNSRSKGLNRSFYPSSEEMYRRTDCTTCVSRADEEGVEMTCADESVDTACRGMDLLVGGSVVCNGYGDCCCQGDDCPEALRNFYSGNQKALGPPRIGERKSARILDFNVLIIVTSLFLQFF